MKICMLTSGHDVYDNRIYYKEILSLRKKYDDIYIIAPGDKDFVTEHGVQVRCFRKRKNWHDRMEPMKRMFELAKDVNADVYHAHEPDSFQVAVNLKKVLGAKIIYDSHEYHPEAFAEHFRFGKSLVTKAVYLFEKKLGKQADCIISVNDILVNKFKKYNKNVLLLPNYPTLRGEDFNKELNGKPTFVYAGGLREDRGIFKILEAINILKSKDSKSRDFRYIFIGPFETVQFESKCRGFVEEQLKDADIIFTGKVPHTEVFGYLKEAFAGFVLLQPGNWRYVNSEPIKLFEYMSSKTPVIASDFPMMERIVYSSKSGLLVKPDSSEDIANAILKMAWDIQMVKSMGENGYTSVCQSYNWAVCEKRLLDAYSKFE